MEINIFQLKTFFLLNKKEGNRTKKLTAAGMFGLKKFYSIFFVMIAQNNTLNQLSLYSL